MSKKRLTPKQIAITVACAAVALLYFWTAYEGQLPTFQQRGILLAFCFVMIFITRPMFKGKHRAWWTICIDVALSLVTVAAVAQLIRVEVVTPITGFYSQTNLDTILTAGLVIAVLEATRRMIGPALPILAIVLIMYAVWGSSLPGIFQHAPVTISRIIYYLGITTDGIWGTPVYVASTVVILFLIFASMLQQCGLMRFFVDFSNGLVGKYRGGSAKVAVIGSSIMSTMSGNAVANVVTVGSFTIPLMKRTGYSSVFAGAVESCASMGGVVTPPVMGAAAFIIAEYLGISYWAVCVAAALPAALFYLGLYVSVDLQAMKTGMKGLAKSEIPDWRKVLLRSGYMVLPIFMLIYFLGVVRSSGMLAAFWATIATVGLGLIRKETRQGLKGFGLVEGFANSVKDSFTVITTCACAGIVVGSLVVTGLSFRLSIIMVQLTGGNIWVLLFFVAVVAILLGMGMTTTSVYLLMAMLVAPALTRVGVMPLAAHMFVFFFANLSHITPPVAIAVFAACAISGEKSFFPTAWQACKLGAVLFILPFFFALNPSLLLQGNAGEVIFAVVTAIIGVIALATALSNYSWFGKINVAERLLFALGGIALIYPGVIASVGGGAVVALTSAYVMLENGRNKKPLAGVT
ncbi:MAG: TRAP transporter fused permease subunit [Dehalococcoidales bacterium]|nr:TRAP transporter fused permease subunit [Dehalococcoidales bacterium]